MSAGAMGTFLLAGGVAGVVGVAFGALALLVHRTAIRPETSRKLAHIVVGLVALSFAWLFESTWPVVALCVGGLAFTLAVRLWAPLRRSVGPVIHGVERRSLGDYCVPVVVPLLHALAMPERVLYVVPLLVLTLADAAAALVGTRVGRWAYRTDEGSKTVEGSLALGVVTGLLVLGSLLLDGRAPERAVSIAILLAVLVMLAEAVSWRGLDNLVLPLGAYALLRIYLEIPAGMILLRVVVAVGFVIVGLVLHRRAGLIGAAGLAVAFVLYASWALGGWAWVVPPLAVLGAMPFVGARADDTPEEDQGVGAVLGMSVGLLLWLFVGGEVRDRSMLLPFLGAASAVLGVVGVVRWRFDRAAGRRDAMLPGKLVLLTVAVAAACCVLPGGAGDPLLTIATMLASLVLAAGLTAIAPAELRGARYDLLWISRSATVVLTSLLGFVVTMYR